MSAFDVTLSEQGAADVRQRLSELSAELQQRAVRAGLNRAGKPILETMQQLVPVSDGEDAGELKQSLARRSLTKNARGRLGLAEGTVAVRIGPIKKVNGYSQAYVGRLVEHGVEPSTRKVYRRIGGTHNLKRRYAHIRAYTYKHPGQKAQPFMAPALKRNAGQFESRFYEGMSAYLKRKGL
ncbi:HK97-gp10 family putative phage morphogenesis protein [Chromohalobacter israelensis]|uniref:HK97-gp10 family putative phage morphogenesis protein n=1 Tax=Chromohalobacter israelensis TaxID=141390 RepID=UPI00265BFFB2|nr:HK97-gp10 family putative phage morphogenesis protein [Chromohalobacter salexigens]MDO0945919.1 HK97 gp10 family phage protein [Chromohalobacter salexigens]